MPLPPDSLGRPAPDRRTGVFADAGRASYAAAKSVSNIDAVLAENKHAVQGRSILDRVFPVEQKDLDEYDRSEAAEVAQWGSSEVTASWIANRLSGGVRHEAPTGGHIQRISDPYFLSSPFGNTARENEAEISSHRVTSGNIDAANLHHEMGLENEPFGFGVPSDMRATHSLNHALDPTTVSEHLTPMAMSDDMVRMSPALDKIHSQIRENPEFASNFSRPQFVGSLLNIHAVQHQKADLARAGRDVGEVWSDENRPFSQGDVYLHHDPESQHTKMTVNFPRSDRELYTINLKTTERGSTTKWMGSSHDEGN